MAGLYGFKDERVARRLRDFAETMPGAEGDQGVRATEIFLFQTPGGGIPARSGTTLGKATCDAYYLSFDGTDADISALQDGGSTLTSTVFNMSTEAVGGSAYIQAVRIYGLYVANWEEC
jgi:hypothetical protein